MTAATIVPEPAEDEGGPLAVFQNGGFLRLWLSQAATQIGGNMVLFGLTVIVFNSTKSNTAVSALILTFLVPAVLFSAVAGVYVDRVDRRLILIATNILRGLAFVALYLAGGNLAVILLLNVAVSTVTVFFAPAELAMIPVLVPRRQLLAANGIFTLTLNAAFAVGFALLGPLVVKVAGPEAVILVVAGLYFLAAVFCVTLPASPPPPSTDEEHHGGLGVGEAERAVETTFVQLREGFSFIRANRSIGWSLIYLGITASLIGVLGVLGPAFAQQTLGLAAEDFAVVVLPLGFGIVTGILLLNSYGRLFPRRRVIEGGLIALGILLAALSAAGPISRLLQRADQPGGLDLSGGDVAAGRRRGHRLLRGHRLRAGRHPVPDAAPGGPARGRPRPGVRRARDARLDRQLPADHRRRADLGAGRHDRGHLRHGDRGDDHRVRLGGDARQALGSGKARRGRSGRDRRLRHRPRIRASVRDRGDQPADPGQAAARSRSGSRARARRRTTPRRPRRWSRSAPARPTRPTATRPPPMARVAVVFTGGTISTAYDPAAGGNVPVLDGAAILARTPGLDAIADVVPIDRGRTPASHFTFPVLLDIAADLRAALADPSIDGAVVVQGTDTIEETSFCWDLVLDGSKPVVVTGAMRASDEAGFDGPANLRDAIRVAAAESMREAGVVVSLGGTIEPADDVTKMHASALDTFASPNGGSLGRVDGSGVRLVRRRAGRRHVATARAAERVHLVTATVAMDGSLLDAAVGAGADGSSSRRPGPATRTRPCWRRRSARWPPGSRSLSRPAVRPAGRGPATRSRRRRSLGGGRRDPGRPAVRGQGPRRARARPRRGAGSGRA